MADEEKAPLELNQHGWYGNPPAEGEVEEDEAPPSKGTQTSHHLSLDDDEEDAAQGCFPHPDPHYSVVGMIWRIPVIIAVGVLVGIALEKTRVFEPRSIRLQMVMQRWIFLKFFLAAVGTGLLALSVMSLIPWVKTKLEEAGQEYQRHFTKKSIVTSIVGSLILGCGITLSASCPLMLLAQLGAWVRNAIFTLIGMIIGGLMYGFIAPGLEKMTGPRKPLKSYQVHTTFNKPFAAFAVPMGIMLALTVFLMEWFIPWTSELDEPNRNGSNIATARAWPPFSGGCMVGLLQVVLVLCVTDTIGGSSAYMTLVSQWVVTRNLQRTFPYMARARCGFDNWWRVIFICSAIGGAVLAAEVAHTRFTVSGPSILTAVFGGILIMLGARFAGGCTGGHGVSGMALLGWLSFVALPCILAGAIAVAFAMQATGALYELFGWSPPIFPPPTTAPPANLTTTTTALLTTAAKHVIKHVTSTLAPVISTAAKHVTNHTTG